MEPKGILTEFREQATQWGESNPKKALLAKVSAIGLSTALWSAASGPYADGGNKLSNHSNAEPIVIQQEATPVVEPN